MSLARALKWSFLSEMTSKAIQPIIFIVLARMLAPDDFGVMSAALMVIAFSQIFWEAGMGKALIQRQTDIIEAANVVFWINIALGLAMASILYVTAAPLAQFIFHDERVTLVVQVMTVQVILGSVSAVHTSLLQKDMGFRKLFWVRFATVSLPGLASVPLAWSGMGYWALVAGALTGQAMQAIMLWRTSEWRPTWSFDTRIAREIGRFGAWVSLSGLLAWFYIWADALIVGMYLGSQELGLYRTGNQFATMIFAVIFGPITPVFYSHFTKMHGDRERLRRALMKIVNAIALVTLPLALLIFSVAEPLSHFVFDKQWTGIGLVIGVMVLSHGISSIFSINGEVFRAVEKPQYETYPMAVGAIVFLPAYILAIKHGLDIFLYTRFALVLLFGATLHSYLANKAISISPWLYMRHTTIYALMVFILLYLHASQENPVVAQTVGVIFSLALFSVYLRTSGSELIAFMRGRSSA